MKNLQIINQNLLFHNSTKEGFYHKIAHDIVYDEPKQLVVRYKENLLWEEDSEFFKRFYLVGESTSRIPKIAEYYSIYSLLIPNYSLLEPNKVLSRYLRKKVKLLEELVVRDEQEEQRNCNFQAIIPKSLIESTHLYESSQLPQVTETMRSLSLIYGKSKYPTISKEWDCSSEENSIFFNLQLPSLKVKEKTEIPSSSELTEYQDNKQACNAKPSKKMNKNLIKLDLLKLMAKPILYKQFKSTEFEKTKFRQLMTEGNFKKSNIGTTKQLSKDSKTEIFKSSTQHTSNTNLRKIKSIVTSVDCKSQKQPLTTKSSYRLIPKCNKNEKSGNTNSNPRPTDFLQTVKSIFKTSPTSPCKGKFLNNNNNIITPFSNLSRIIEDKPTDFPAPPNENSNREIISKNIYKINFNFNLNLNLIKSKTNLLSEGNKQSAKSTTSNTKTVFHKQLKKDELASPQQKEQIITATPSFKIGHEKSNKSDGHSVFQLQSRNSKSLYPSVIHTADSTKMQGNLKTFFLTNNIFSKENSKEKLLKSTKLNIGITQTKNSNKPSMAKSKAIPNSAINIHLITSKSKTNQSKKEIPNLKTNSSLIHLMKPSLDSIKPTIFKPKFNMLSQYKKDTQISENSQKSAICKNLSIGNSISLGLKPSKVADEKVTKSLKGISTAIAKSKVTKSSKVLKEAALTRKPQK